MEQAFMLYLSPKAFEEFVALLEEEPKEMPKLKAMMEQPSFWAKE